MFFASDNGGPVHPAIMAALAGANGDHASGYGNDAVTHAAQDAVRRVFEAPDAMVHFVATGTAANSLALACLCPPWGTVFCSPVAHVQKDECNAPEFFMGGAKLTLVPGSDRMTPDALRAAIAAEESRGIHGAQRGPVTITQVTEMGHVYTLDELAALVTVAKEFGLPVHLDGARFANALVALGCTAAEMTWKLGIDAVSFGGTKNGCMGVEAVVFFDPRNRLEFEYRRKRGAHLFSKHRYLAAQMQGYLADDLWLRLARDANARMARLADGLRGLNHAHFVAEPHANMAFVQMPRGVHRHLQGAGAYYYIWSGDLDHGPDDEMLTCRLVTDWSVPEGDIDRFLSLARA
jgi:threonine aldolase